MGLWGVPGWTALPMIASGAMREPTDRREATAATRRAVAGRCSNTTSTGCRSLMASSAVFDPAPCWHVRAKPRDAPRTQRSGVAGGRPALRWRRAFGPWRARREDVAKLARRQNQQNQQSRAQFARETT
jgi:hypothetical protein